MKGSWGQEMDHISHSGQIQNTLLCHAMVTILVHVSPFWCILVHIMCNPMTPQWLALTHLLFQVSIYSRNSSYWSLRTNLKQFALSCYGHHFSALWCTLVHFGEPHVQPHDPLMTCSDSYTLSSVHLFQKWITLVTQHKFEKLCSVMLWTPF